MSYSIWDYSVVRLYSSPGVPGTTLHFRNWIWFLIVFFVTPDDGKVQKLINPECEVAVHPANWHSLLFVQIRSLLTVLCHCLRRQGRRIHFCGGASLQQLWVWCLAQPQTNPVFVSRFFSIFWSVKFVQLVCKMFSLFLTEDTGCVRYKIQPVNVVSGNICSLCLQLLKQLVDAVASMVQSTSYECRNSMTLKRIKVAAIKGSICNWRGILWVQAEKCMTEQVLLWRKKEKLVMEACKGHWMEQVKTLLILNLRRDQVITPEGILSVTGSCCGTSKKWLCHMYREWLLSGTAC
jgi:hypothetical protein